MSGRDPIKDTGRELQMFSVRAITAAVIALLLATTVFTRLVVLQVVDHQHYQSLSQGNRVRIEPVPPTRGLIFDRNGILLAENITAYQLELIPEQVEHLDTTLQRLRDLDLLDDEDESRFRANLKKNARRFNPVPLKFRLTEEELARFAVQRQNFPGVDFRARPARHYPLGQLAVHAIGYVGNLSLADLERIDNTEYAGTTHIGKTGVERAYEDELHGKVGYQHVVVNAQGRSLQILKRSPPIPGKDLYLTLDVPTQRAAEEALDGRRGSVVALDPFNGEVLALASTPGYDPNAFARGLSSREYARLRDDPSTPFLNRALSGQYPPGSTIKPILGLAALHYHTLNPWEKSYCQGYYSIPGNDHRYRDWKIEGHGEMNLVDAIEQSCDVYFYQLALELGIDRIQLIMKLFGFGSRTNIDIRGERSGLMPSREWKKKRFKTPAERVWFPGETVITGIGQGSTLTTPLQLAYATAAIATHGRRFRPRLVDAVRDRTSGEIEQRAVEPQMVINIGVPGDWQHIIDAMIGVVHGQRGTARAVGLNSEYRIAGKTGTAQVFTVGQDETYDDLDLKETQRDHAWFVAFAPAAKPRIAVVVLVENGGSGSGTAAPIARRVMDAYLLDQFRPDDGT
ncbi:MAG: penicillin-binding protein 2 [Gammaproteobacteria bacterium]|nr:penicillin-binding protein 2 [Gammaproteobacteria bacterium]